MLERTDRVTPETLRRLHAEVVAEPEAIRQLLERARQARVELRLRLNRNVEPESAEIVRVEPGELVLRTRNLDATGRSFLTFNLSVDGKPYFFLAPAREAEGEDLLRVGMPAEIYAVDRRARVRRELARPQATPRVALQNGGSSWTEADVLDLSGEGLALRLRESEAAEVSPPLRVRFLDGPLAGEERWAEVRHRARDAERPGWLRLGVAFRSRSEAGELRIERRDDILAGLPAPGPDACPVPPLSPEVRIFDYPGAAGEPMRAIVDFVGDPEGALAVVIPPAWGRTKETLLPLAATLLATFAQAGESLVVVRFDGIRKRGESYKDPDCRAPGREQHRFTFSQGVRDIHATLDALARAPEFRTERAVLVSFSASTIEARRAVLEDAGRRIVAWIAVVGASDMQAPLRVISGGLDYVGGPERGVRFGLQEIQGVVFDVDYMSSDLLAHRLGFLEDARRDLAGIRVPITWIHGRHDAWMDLERVHEALSSGDVSRRSLIEVPTGHQLRASREALQVFQLISSEAGRLVLGRPLAPATPDLQALEVRRRAERDRLPRGGSSFRSFWHDYLLGREGGLGIELMTASRAYRMLMEQQVQALELTPGDRVADLGSGTGSLPLELAARGIAPDGLVIDQVDYVVDALDRARARLGQTAPRPGWRVNYLAADLDPALPNAAIPLASARYDALLASLVLSYVSDPARLLREMYRLLRPGGRLVLSTLRRDADTSKLFVEMVDELRSGRALELFGAEQARDVAASARRFLNDAARLLDFEEQGRFHFWDPPELERLVLETGFEAAQTRLAFGDPPQAVVLSARRPR